MPAMSRASTAPASRSVHSRATDYALHPVFATRAESEALKARSGACHVDLRASQQVYRTTTTLGSTNYTNSDDMFRNADHQQLSAMHEAALAPVAPSSDMKRALYGSHIKLGDSGGTAKQWEAQTHESYRVPAGSSSKPTRVTAADQVSSVKFGSGMQPATMYQTTSASSFPARDIGAARQAQIGSRLSTTASSVKIGAGTEDRSWETSTAVNFGGFVRGGAPPPLCESTRLAFTMDHLKIGTEPDQGPEGWRSSIAEQYVDKSGAGENLAQARVTWAARRRALAASSVTLGRDRTFSATTTNKVGYPECAAGHTKTEGANPELWKSSVRMGDPTAGAVASTWKTAYDEEYTPKKVVDEAVISERMDFRSGIRIADGGQPGDDDHKWGTTTAAHFQPLGQSALDVLAEGSHEAQASKKGLLECHVHINDGSGSRSLPKSTTAEAYVPKSGTLSKDGFTVKYKGGSSVKLGSGGTEEWQRMNQCRLAPTGRTLPLTQYLQRSHWKVGGPDHIPDTYSTTSLGSYHYKQLPRNGR